MSKNKESKLLKGKPVLGIGDADPLKIVSNGVNKKGKFSGSKKEKKAKRDICQHHIITKKGKVKPTIEPDGKGVCRCYLCGDIVETQLANEGEVAKVTNQFYSKVTQAVFMAQSLGAGHKVIEQLTDTKILTRRFPKCYNNLANVARKQDRVKKNKKNKNSGYGGSSQYGSWGIRR